MRLFAGYSPVLWALALFFLGLGFTARVDLPLAILAITAALAFGESQRQPLLPLLKEHWALLFFLLVAIVTTGMSVDWRHSVRVQPQLLPALLCYAVIVTFVTSLTSLRFVYTALLVSGLLTACLMLLGVSRMTADDPLAKVKLLGNALLIVPNDVLMLSVIAPLTLALAWCGNRWVRVLVAVYLLLALITGAMLESRQAVIIWVVGVVAVVAIMRPRWAIPVLLVGAGAGLLLDGLLGWPLAHKIFMFPRSYVWHTAWVMFLDRPWSGQGPGMFKDLYLPFLAKAGYVLAELGDHRMMPWAHSLYLEQLAERGVVGLLALLCLLGTAVVQSIKAVGMALAPEERSLAAGIVAALLALIISGIAEATLSRLWVTVLVLTLVAMSLRLEGCTKLGRASQIFCGGVLK
jgi:O-antigen ligase